MIVSLIAAMAENRVIGRGNAIPWRLPEDLRRFKALTMGHPLIMGRRTFESIGRPLPGRRCIVLSRTAPPLPGLEVARTLPAALDLVSAADEAFVAGGGMVYQEAFPHASRIYLTVVHAAFEGDTYFPRFSSDEWSLTDDVRHVSEGESQLSFSFRRYERR